MWLNECWMFIDHSIDPYMGRSPIGWRCNFRGMIYYRLEEDCMILQAVMLTKWVTYTHFSCVCVCVCSITYAVYRLRWESLSFQWWNFWRKYFKTFKTFWTSVTVINIFVEKTIKLDWSTRHNEEVSSTATNSLFQVYISFIFVLYFFFTFTTNLNHCLVWLQGM
jgi:hypothetical protein